MKPQLAVFGSAARGTSDSHSDFDVIAVIADAKLVERTKLEQNVAAQFGREVGLSIYSERRLRLMWKQGSPFAWHLYLQAQPVDGYRSEFIKSWGPPSPYVNARKDGLMMLGILESALDRLSSVTAGCECYEAGLLYVGARNLGMFASEEKVGHFDFSRYAPFALQDPFEFPLDKSSYLCLISARHATTRGAPLPTLDRERLVFWGGEVLSWARRLAFSLGQGN